MSSGGGSMFPLCERDNEVGSSYSVSSPWSLDPSLESRVLISKMAPMLSVVDVSGVYT